MSSSVPSPAMDIMPAHHLTARRADLLTIRLRTASVWMAGVLWVLGATAGTMAAPQPLAPPISSATTSVAAPAVAAPPMSTQPIQLAEMASQEHRSHAGAQDAGRDRRRAGEHTREAREPRPKHDRGQARTRQEPPDSRGAGRPPGQERSPAKPAGAIEERRPVDKGGAVERGHRQFDNLSPQQQQRIREARERFQQLPPEERARLRQRWHALPPEERRRWSDTQEHDD